MDKQHIINEIHRTAIKGKALGQRRFETETRIKPSQWQGKYWSKWGDALTEAGYPPNEWTPALDETHILESLLH